MDPKWEGGWKISSIKSPVTTEITDGQRIKVVHVNRLRHRFPESGDRTATIVNGLFWRYTIVFDPRGFPPWRMSWHVVTMVPCLVTWFRKSMSESVDVNHFDALTICNFRGDWAFDGTDLPSSFPFWIQFSCCGYWLTTCNCPTENFLLLDCLDHKLVSADEQTLLDSPPQNLSVRQVSYRTCAEYASKSWGRSMTGGQLLVVDRTWVSKERHLWKSVSRLR